MEFGHARGKFCNFALRAGTLGRHINRMLARKVLITGGFGYVGSRLTPYLLNRGHEVRVLDLLLYGDAGLRAVREAPSFPDWKGRFELIEGDIRDQAVLDRATDGVEVIIHLAAISNDPTGDLDEVLTRQVNFDAIGSLLCAAKERGVQRFINASSSSVFGIKAALNVTEDLEPEPLTWYSKYKALSEWLVLAASSDDFCVVNVRPATICGFSPRQRFDLTVNKLTSDAVRKRVITVHGGDQRRPNASMTDMVELYSRLVSVEGASINRKTFNFGFENHKVIEIARIIQDELKELHVEIKVTDNNDHRDYHISSAKIQDQLGYRPMSSIRQEVRQLWQALEEGQFPDTESPEFYNLKCMKLDRNSGAYVRLAKN